MGKMKRCCLMVVYVAAVNVAHAFATESISAGVVLIKDDGGGDEKKEFYTPEADKKAAEKKEDVKARVDLPNVLLLGDSISIGYTPYVVDGLKGKANVIRAKANCGDTNKGKKNVGQWLITKNVKKWDVIHFNFGLHDLCYRHPDSKVYGKRDKVKGSLSVTLEQYEKNLEAIVAELKKTNAKLVWASTTLVPEGEAGRRVGDDEKYNVVAAKVMAKHGIVVNDLYGLTAKFDAKLFVRPGDVHFTKKGSRMLGRQVVKSISDVLEK